MGTNRPVGIEVNEPDRRETLHHEKGNTGLIKITMILSLDTGEPPVAFIALYLKRGMSCGAEVLV